MKSFQWGWSALCFNVLVVFWEPATVIPLVCFAYASVIVCIDSQSLLLEDAFWILMGFSTTLDSFTHLNGWTCFLYIICALYRLQTRFLFIYIYKRFIFAVLIRNSKYFWQNLMITVCIRMKMIFAALFRLPRGWDAEG